MKNINNEFDIMNLMDEIEYGWMDVKGNKHTICDERFSDDYILQSPFEIEENKIGVCWDQVELERFYFDMIGVKTTTYFIVYYDNNDCPTHTFLTFEKNDEYYWFEHSWQKFKGIHKYFNLEELLLDVKNKFMNYELNNNYVKQNICIYSYRKPKFHLNVEEFYKHCESGIKIK